MNLLKNVIKIIYLISKRRRIQLILILILMTLGVLAEMVSIGAVVPLINVISKQSQNNSNSITFQFIEILEKINIKTGEEIIVAFSILYLSASIFKIIIMWISIRFAYGLGGDLGSKIFREILKKNYTWHISRNSSETISGIEKVNILVGGVITPIMQGTVAILSTFGILVTMLLIEFKITVITMATFLIVYSATMYMYKNKLLKNGSLIAKNSNKRIQIIQEGLGGIRDIIIEKNQRYFEERYNKYDYEMKMAQASNNLVGAAPRHIVESLGVILIIIISMWMSENRGGFIEIVPLIGLLAIGAQKILPQIQLIYYSWTCMLGSERVLDELIDIVNNDEDSKSNDKRIVGRKIIKNEEVLIYFKNVSFAYKDKEEILKDINFKIKKGDRVGIIGESGAGKSTLIDLMMGLLINKEGEILFEGETNTESKITEWHKKISHVPQSIYLTDGSIIENIAFGKEVENIEVVKVKRAAKMAQIENFIENSYQKYEETVGERGVKLSGGQRQRIGIARALYKEAEIIFMDEITSALDEATETNLIKSFKQIPKNVTVILVAHRKSTLAMCNIIIEIKNGRCEVNEN